MPQRLCFFLCFLLPLLLLSSSSMAINPLYADCSQHLHCGHLTEINVTYPFRLPQSPSYCGLSGYELNCNLYEDASNQLTIKLGNRDYAIMYIERLKGIMRVVDSYLTNTGCHLNFTNTSINSTPFIYTNWDSNLTVYINCSFATKSNELMEISCLKDFDGQKKSYYKVGYEPSTLIFFFPFSFFSFSGYFSPPHSSSFSSSSSPSFSYFTASSLPPSLIFPYPLLPSQPPLPPPPLKSGWGVGARAPRPPL